MAKIKKKYKGVRYVAKVLKKYYPKRYKNQREALGQAREVFQKLQTQGRKTRVVDILDLTRKHRGKPEVKKPEAPTAKPLLFYKFFLDTYYFDLQNYPADIQSTTNEITFVSKLFNEGVTEIRGGSRPEYNKTFSSFVNYINKNLTSRDDAYEYLVKGTSPEWNPETQRWESRIISIDPTGEETDFGYRPTPTKAPTKEEIEEIDKKIIEPSKVEPSPKSESKSSREKELELELLIEKEKTAAKKAENQKALIELFKDGLLSKEEFKDLMNKIK